MKAKFKLNLNASFYVFFALSISAFALLIFSTRSFIIDIKDTGLSMYSGMRGGIYSATSFVSNNVNAFQRLLAVQKENKELIAKIERYQQLERGAAEIRAENRRLREQLGFSETLRYKHIAAEIIGRDPDNLFSSLVINKGLRHGVKKDMPVIAYQNGMQALVGKIIQAGQFESLVLPIYDAQSYISSRFAASRYEGISSGLGDPGDPIFVRFIDKRAKNNINIGDLVVTSGIGGVYPAEIIIGRVRRIIQETEDSAFETELESAADFSRLEYVFVIESESVTPDNTTPDEW